MEEMDWSFEAGICLFSTEQKLGVNGAQMDDKWSQLKRGKDLIKFGGGFYAGKVGDIFVING